MVRKIAFALFVYTFVLILLIAPLATLAFALTTLIEPRPVAAGELVDSYALQNGGAIIIAQQVTDNSTRLEIVYLTVDNDRDTLYQINLSSVPTKIQTEVCGGRLHLTYELDDAIGHKAISIPSANLGFLPIVCKETE